MLLMSDRVSPCSERCSRVSLGRLTSICLALSFTTTVPAVDDYETYASAVAGATWPTTGYLFGYIDSRISTGPLGPYYIDSTQPPTPTPSGAGEPVPALSGFGILAMIAILAGVAILVMYGRKQ